MAITRNVVWRRVVGVVCGLAVCSFTLWNTEASAQETAPGQNGPALAGPQIQDSQLLAGAEADPLEPLPLPTGQLPPANPPAAVAPAPAPPAVGLPMLDPQSVEPLVIPDAPTAVRPPTPPLPEGLGLPPGEQPFPADQFTPEEAMETLSRGPVHEAFVDVYDLDPEASEIVSRQPPVDVEELAPEQMPEGENVQWIPGYWSWDEEVEDFLWVGGLWRDVPPGQRWVPGYWTEVEGGYRWVSGFWSSAESTELAYLPTPPQSLEVGPNIAAPGDDYFWIPGAWNYQANHYQWSPGYWSPIQENWIWVPQRYVWTPRGCLYTRGYWDYRLSRRGLLFAPVRFHRHYHGYRFANYRYRPRYGISMGRFLVNLFVRPARRNYFFGDYYGPRYANAGYQPWHHRTVAGGRRAYDPVFNYYNWQSRRSGIDFTKQLNSWNQYYVNNADQRPPRTQVAQRDFLARNHSNNDARDNSLLRSLRGDSREPQIDLRLRDTDKLVQQRHTEAVKLIRNVEQDRRKIEKSVIDLQRGLSGSGRNGSPPDRDGKGFAGVIGKVPDGRGGTDGRNGNDGKGQSDGRTLLNGRDAIDRIVSSDGRGSGRSGSDVRGDEEPARLKLSGIPDLLKERSRGRSTVQDNEGGNGIGLGGNSRNSTDTGRDRDGGRTITPSTVRSFADQIRGADGRTQPRNAGGGGVDPGDLGRRIQGGTGNGSGLPGGGNDRQNDRRIEQGRSDIGRIIENGRSNIGRPDTGRGSDGGRFDGGRIDLGRPGAGSGDLNRFQPQPAPQIRSNDRGQRVEERRPATSGGNSGFGNQNSQRSIPNIRSLVPEVRSSRAGSSQSIQNNRGNTPRVSSPPRQAPSNSGSRGNSGGGSRSSGGSSRRGR